MKERTAAPPPAGVPTVTPSRSAAEWIPVFDAADCCCSIVQDVRTALRDPHFAARGLFARTLANEQGAIIPALPVPILPVFRDPADTPQSTPPLGAHNSHFGLVK